MKLHVRSALICGVTLLGLSTMAAAAVSLTSTQVGEIYCAARLSGDMAPVLAILTPELAALVAKSLPAGTDAASAVPWQASPDYASSCAPVGASGTFETPEIVIAFGYRDPAKAGYADSLIMKFVEKRLRIDDVRYGDSKTLRQRLGAGF